MNLSEFKTTYVTNEHRVALFAELQKFIKDVEEYFHPYTIAVYGSFITEKPDPSDIDVLLHGYVKRDKVGKYNPKLFRGFNSLVQRVG